MKAFEELLVKGMKQYIQLAKALQAKKRAKRLAQVQAQAQRDGQTSSVVNKELPEEKEPVITKEIMDIIIQNAKDTLKARQRYQ